MSGRASKSRPIRVAQQQASADAPASRKHADGRRDRALTSLFATAKSLTALGEIDDVLGAIVTHAHELIGTDFTYLSVFDDSGNLTLKASEGTFSSGFKSARVPATTGVGARVVETGAAHWVIDYLADTDLKHDASFDEVVRAEGMKAVLGVPLLIGGTVVGVLYAADRSPRPFTVDEVAMLSAFADHAAVALENARLYAETRDALAQLQQAYSTIEAQVDMMERSAAVHEELTRLVLSGGSAGQVAEMLVGHLGGQVSVYDRSAQVTVSRQTPGEQVSPPVAIPTTVIDECRRHGRRVEYVDDDGARHHVIAVLASESTLGYLVLTRSEGVEDVDARTLERSAQIIGLLTLTQEALVEAEERVRGEILTELLSSNRVDEGLRARATARGLDITRLNSLVIADAGPERLLAVARRLHGMSSEWRGLTGEHLGRAVMVLETSDGAAAAQAIHRRLRAEMGRPVSVVLGQPSPGAHGWEAVFTLTNRCNQVVRVVGDGDRGVTTEDYAMYALAFDPDRGQDLERFLWTTIGPLLDYDERRSAELVPTLFAYFDAASNTAEAARRLHVHVNTLLKRLERVGTLLGDDWRKPENALRLHLAIRLHRLSQHL